MGKDSNYITHLLEAYESISEAIDAYRTKEFPIGSPVLIENGEPSMTYGIVVSYPVNQISHVGVLMESGNVWFSPITSIKIARLIHAPKWVHDEMERRSRSGVRT